MKRWFVSAGLMIVCLGFLASVSMAQMGGGPGGPGGGGFPPPPDSSVSELSPDGKLLYVYSKGALYQYSALDMTLMGSALVDSSAQTSRPGPPMLGGANAKLLFGPAGKRIFIVQGKNIYVYDTDGLKYLSRTILPDSP